jgi:hypothetical protein
MKPLYILLLLLFTLVISLVFSKYLPVIKIISYKNNIEEGFISFANTADISNRVHIKLYSERNTNTTYKLYDSIFYDMTNGYIIEVDSVKFDTTSDNLGLYVNGIYVVSRSGSFNTNIIQNKLLCRGVQILGKLNEPDKAAECVVQTATPETAYATALSTKYQTWSYNTSGNETDKYLVIYLSYDVLTFIHIINQTQRKHIITYTIVGSESIKYNSFSSSTALTVSDAKQNTDINNNTYVIDTAYDSKIKLYQFTDTVKLDENNGYLITKNKDDGKITVYNRAGDKQPDFKGNIPVDMANYATQSKSWVVPDGNGSQVLYIPLSKITVLFEIIYEDSKFKSRRTYITGKYNNDIIVDPSKVDAPSSSSSSTSTDSSGCKVDLDKYILKTQIIPPVCPSCPKCPCYNGVCNDCGGNGGSGSSNSESRSSRIRDKIKNFFKNGRRTDAEEAADDAADEAEDKASDAKRDERNAKIKSKLKNFFENGRHTDAEEAIEDAEREARNDKIKYKLKNFFKNGRDDGEDIYSSDEDDYLYGNTDLRYSSRWDDDYRDNKTRRRWDDDYRDNTYWGYKPSEREFREQERNIQNTYNVPQSTTPSTIPGVDPYSYFGALVPKSGYNDYMPITADFSSFGL